MAGKTKQKTNHKQDNSILNMAKKNLKKKKGLSKKKKRDKVKKNFVHFQHNDDLIIKKTYGSI